jgi:hypothetical protein
MAVSTFPDEPGDPAEIFCRNCGIVYLAAPEDAYEDRGRTYCCKHCAAGCLCTCQKCPPPRLAPSVRYSGPERRNLPQRRAWKQERRAIFLQRP